MVQLDKCIIRANVMRELEVERDRRSSKLRSYGSFAAERRPSSRARTHLPCPSAISPAVLLL